MNRGIRNVRKSIEQRKKMKLQSSMTNRKHLKSPPFPGDDEKHGYYPTFQHDVTSFNKKKISLAPLLIKGILSLMLFVGTAFVLEADNDFFSLPQSWTSKAMNEEFPFARVHQWYQTTFGSPMGFSPGNEATVADAKPALPISGNISESFQTNGTGIGIAPESTSDVAALKSGIVIFDGNDRQRDKTVVIQHADGTKSTYGYLEESNVHIYQFVASDQKIGTFNPTESRSTLYFSIQENNEFIDPVNVIQVDDES